MPGIPNIPQLNLSELQHQELRRRNAFSRLALLILGAHLVVLVYQTYAGNDYQRNASLTGGLIVGVIWLLGRYSRAALPTLESLGVGLGIFWLLADIVQPLLLHQPLSLYVIFDLSMVGLLAFTWLPLRPAITLLSACYLLTVTAYLASGNTEYPALVMGGVLLALTGYMSEYGRQLSLERTQAAWLHELAFRDPLTALATRRAADHYLSTLAHQENTALVLLDIDHFKTINDNLGHLEGDQVLKEVAEALRGSIRRDDLVCRWGGEEFFVVLKGVTQEQAKRRIEQMREKIAQSVSRISVTVSAGGVMLGEVADHQAALALADERLYTAKNQGRDRSVWA